MSDDNTPSKKAAPHQNDADRTTVMTLLRTGKYNLENPPHEEIKKDLGWETKYPNKGAWKNFMTRVVNLVRVEQSDTNRKVYSNEAEEKVSTMHYHLVSIRASTHIVLLLV
jgi:hypothetical protein